MARYIKGRTANKVATLTQGTFDSPDEYLVYQKLIAIFGVEDVETHGYYLISKGIKKCYDIGWKYDFYIKSLDLYVEAKGISTDNFKMKMQFFRNLHPEDFSKILFVTKAKTPKLIIRDVHTVTIPGMIKLLCQMKRQRESTTS